MVPSARRRAEGDANGGVRKVVAAEHGLDDLGDLHPARVAHVDLDVEGDEVSHGARPRERRGGARAADRDRAQELRERRPACRRRRCGARPASSAPAAAAMRAREPRLAPARGDARSAARHDVARGVEDLARPAASPGAEPRAADEAKARLRRRRQRLEQRRERRGPRRSSRRRPRRGSRRRARAPGRTSCRASGGSPASRRAGCRAGGTTRGSARMRSRCERNAAGAELLVDEAVAPRLADVARAAAAAACRSVRRGRRRGSARRSRGASAPSLRRNTRRSLAHRATGRTRRRSRSRRACASSARASSRFVWWTNAPATLPHGGDSRLFERLAVLARRKPSSSPTSMWSHGRRAVTGSVPRYVATVDALVRRTPPPRGRCASGLPTSRSARRRGTRARARRRAGDRRARRCPRATTCRSRASRRSTLRGARLFARASAASRARASSASIAHHWNGVCGLGTCVETLTVTFGGRPRRARCLTRLPTARARPPTRDDPAHVVVFLGRQADHEVELHRRPAAREDALGRLDELLLGDVLVDDVAHALRARLGREREPGRAHARDVVEQFSVEAVGAQRRDAERHLLRRERVGDLLDERRDARVVGGRERR